jgi:hypothetical protein
MHPQLAAALSRLDQATHDMRAAVDAVPSPLRSQKPALERWSMNEVLEHVAKVEELFVGSLVASIEKARAAGLGAEIDDPAMLSDPLKIAVEDRTTPRVAPEHVRPTGSIDAAAALAMIQSGHARLRETLEAADGLALSAVTFDHRVFGALNIYQWVDFIAGHERRHLAQLRETAGQVAVQS